MSEPSVPTASSARRRHALLGARARRLARPRKLADAVASTTCLVCEAGGGLYAFSLDHTQRVAPFEQAAHIPTNNPALLGVIGRAGVFYHVYDLGALLGVGAGSRSGHVILLRGEAPNVAIRTDRVLGIADLIDLAPDASSRMQPAHPAVRNFARPLSVSLFEGRTISLLDPAQLTSGLQDGRSEGDQRDDQ